MLASVSDFWPHYLTSGALGRIGILGFHCVIKRYQRGAIPCRRASSRYHHVIKGFPIISERCPLVPRQVNRGIVGFHCVIKRYQRGALSKGGTQIPEALVFIGVSLVFSEVRLDRAPRKCCQCWFSLGFHWFSATCALNACPVNHGSVGFHLVFIDVHWCSARFAVKVGDTKARKCWFSFGFQ